MAYGKIFFVCPHCGKKGAYIWMPMLGSVPPYATMRCRYCKEIWESSDKAHDPLAKYED